jgi:ectoine hydroxylase-related dioxygenase (phytanoyl-CoA dioxygenase family)
MCPSVSEQRLPSFASGSSAIAISTLSDHGLLDEVRGVVGFFFDHEPSHYKRMETGAYREIVAQAQEELNRRELARRLAADRRSRLKEILGTDEILVQTNLYLRATRPGIEGQQENIGWHRETFYGPDMAASVNLWMPIANVSISNALRYVPDSHLIPEEQIVTRQQDDSSVARFSAGHKIGLLYAPKTIVGGVDLENHRAMVVAPGEVAIFAGNLIHGAAENRSEQLRFSVDFRLIAADQLKTFKQHFSSGRQYFEPL